MTISEGAKLARRRQAAHKAAGDDKKYQKFKRLSNEHMKLYEKYYRKWNARWAKVYNREMLK